MLRQLSDTNYYIMADKEDIKQLRYKIKPALAKLENVATALNFNGNRQAMNILEAIGNIDSALDEAERLAKR